MPGLQASCHSPDCSSLEMTALVISLRTQVGFRLSCAGCCQILHFLSAWYPVLASEKCLNDYLWPRKNYLVLVHGPGTEEPPKNLLISQG